jgi:hypothetical protein
VRADAVRRGLVAFAIAVLVGHHLGTVLGPLGDLGAARWADWIDLAVPYAVLGSAAATLAATRPDRWTWALLGAVGILYTQGHGIHLAANAIAEVEPSDTVHLWDETVGHWLWYSALALVVAILARGVDTLPSPRNPWSVALSLGFGFTVFTNSVEGGTVALGFLSGAVFLVWGLRSRGRAPELLVPTYAVTLLGLVGWGLYWGGFPQFSELGWI